jgi:hypothetical protein
MEITRRGKSKNYGLYVIASTKDKFEVNCLANGSIQILLANDHERSGGGEHLHLLRINLCDIALILKELEETTRVNESFCTKLAEAFSRNITSLETLKYAILSATDSTCT